MQNPSSIGTLVSQYSSDKTKTLVETAIYRVSKTKENKKTLQIIEISKNLKSLCLIFAFGNS